MNSKIKIDKYINIKPIIKSIIKKDKLLKFSFSNSKTLISSEIEDKTNAHKNFLLITMTMTKTYMLHNL